MNALARTAHSCLLSVLLVACAAGGEPHGPNARSGVVPSPSSRARDCRLVSKQVRAYRRHEAEFNAHPTAAGLADVAQAKITLADELDRIQAADPAMREPITQFAVMHREEGKSLAARDEEARQTEANGAEVEAAGRRVAATAEALGKRCIEAKLDDCGPVLEHLTQLPAPDAADSSRYPAGLRTWTATARTMALKDPKVKGQLAQIIADLEKMAVALENRAKLASAQKRDVKPETDRHRAVEALRALCKGVREDPATAK